jgi:hypothetical protein
MAASRKAKRKSAHGGESWPAGGAEMAWRRKARKLMAAAVALSANEIMKAEMKWLAESV